MRLDWFSDFRVRIGLLACIGLAGFGILGAKLYFEQVRRSDAYRERISRQMLRRIRIPGHRGKIFTSDLRVLADNSAGISAVFYPEEMRRPGRNSRARTIEYIKQAAAAAATAIGRPDPLTRQSIARHLNLYPGLPITVFTGLTTAESARILELARQFSGIGIEPYNSRVYPMGRTACHIIGFAGRENPLAALDRREYFYYVPDLIGRSGLEKLFDRTLPWPEARDLRALRGSAGFELVQVDSLGFVRDSKVDYAPPEDGNHLILTLDSRAQVLAEKALSGRQGAMAVLDAATGEVLALASSPGFSPEECTPVLKPEVYRKLRNDPAKPLLPRACMGTYTPGSILKVLVAMALLEHGVDPEEKVECTGSLAIGDTEVHCSSTYGHGPVNLTEAIERSCNVYFMEYGMKLGLAPIAEVLASAGLGESSGFLLPHATGTFPDEAVKKRRTGKPWNKFDTALLAMGQGYITITPLQAAVYTAAIANGGKIMRPYIVRAVVDGRGGTRWQAKPQCRKQLAVSPENLEIVRRGMDQAVHSPEGSGRRAASPIVSLCGKTGSAEVGPRSHRRKNVWFIAYGTVRGRLCAAAMVMEDGRSGGLDCAPAVAAFFEQWQSGER